MVELDKDQNFIKSTHQNLQFPLQLDHFIIVQVTTAIQDIMKDQKIINSQQLYPSQKPQISKSNQSSPKKIQQSPYQSTEPLKTKVTEIPKANQIPRYTPIQYALFSRDIPNFPQRIVQIPRQNYNQKVTPLPKCSSNLPAQELKTINDQLISASQSFNLQEIQKLIAKGADVNCVQRSNSDSWYSGDSNTPLYVVMNSKFNGDETNFIKVIETLLIAGANPNFQALRGGWNHCVQYSMLNKLSETLVQFKTLQSKIKLMELLVRHGINLNQSEDNERGKNHRAYRIHSCFIFKILDRFGFPSKINQLTKLYEKFNIEDANIDREQKLKSQFQRQMNIKLSNRPIFQQQKQQIVPQKQFIEALINLGVHGNSCRSQYYWENHLHSHMMYGYSRTVEQEQKYESMKIFIQKQRYQQQYLLHRAIMNNMPDLVELLIQKGAKVQVPCKITIKKYIFPNQWPLTLVNKKIKENNRNIYFIDKARNETIQKLKIATSQKKQQLIDQLHWYDFDLFKRKRFSIQNQLPVGVDETIHVTCLDMAEKLKVDQRIIDILKANAKKI